MNQNASVSLAARQAATQVENAPAQAEVFDNRERLNIAFQGQTNELARNVVNGFGYNFSDAAAAKSVDGQAEGRRLNRQWLDKNRLVIGEEEEEAPNKAAAKQMSARPAATPTLSAGTRIFLGGAQPTSQMGGWSQPSANPVLGRDFQGEVPVGSVAQDESVKRLKDSESVEQYRQQLSRQAGAQQPAGYGARAESQDRARVMEESEESPAESAATKPAGAPAAGEMGGAAFQTKLSLVVEQTQIVPSGGPAAAPPAAGLASLDFQLPRQGALYCFTTPQGEVEITARAVSTELLRRLIEIAVVAAAALVVWFAIKFAQRGGLAWWAGRSGSTLLICLGLLSLCGGVLPVVGLAAVIVGAAAKIQRRLGRPQPAV